MVNVEQFKAVHAGLIELFEVFSRNFFTRFDVNLTSLLIDKIKSRIAAEDFFGWDQERNKAIFFRLIGSPRTDLLTGREHDFTRLGVTTS